MLINIIKLAIASILPVIFSALLYTAEKKSAFSKLPCFAKQLIIGLIFGGLAVAATELGVEVNGASINVRDSAAISAGLIFGGPAGIIAGIIGGIERFFASFRGVGQYTQIACSLATVLAGFLAAGMRKLIFDNKRPSWFYGFILVITTEVLHMLLILFTHMSEIYTAFAYVDVCYMIMILCNSVAVMLSLITISFFERKASHGKKHKTIEKTFRTRLFICVSIAIFFTVAFNNSIQKNMAESEAEYLLKINIQDVREVIQKAYSENTSQEEIFNRLSSVSKNWHIGENGCVIICDKNGNVISDRDGHTGENLNEDDLDVSSSRISNGERFTANIHNDLSYCLCVKEGDFYIVATYPTEEALEAKYINICITIFIEIIVFAALFAQIYFLIKKYIVNNMHSINASLEKITSGNLDEKVSVYTNEEFSLLSDDINNTVSTLKHYIKEAEERIDRELELARQIQHSALPSVFPPYPNRLDFEIFADMYTAKEVGGDFYDFYSLGEDKLTFLIADVSDKGIPAAMFMMTAKTIIKNLTESGLDASEIFEKANKKLCENNDAGMFVTAWLGILNLKTGLLQYVNAGHNPPVIRHKGGNFEFICTRANFVLAGMDNIKYRTYEMQLVPGDEIFLYTDGVTEAATGSKELFGEDRLLECLNEKRDLSVKDLCKKIKKDVDCFVCSAPQFDDITMLAVKLNCLQTENSLSVVPNKDSLQIAYSFVDRQTAKLHIDKDTENKIKIAADEIYSNIVNYSGASNAKIKVFSEDDFVYLAFYDDGEPYNPLTAQQPDTSLDIESRKSGGLGIFITKKLASKTHYLYKDGCNILTIAFDSSTSD
ncbi:MAG: SpoIIE family protein phosphatase [Ruminococcus sp.]